MRLRLLTCVLVYLASQASSENSLEAYFLNDSVNGFQLSDAYETHSMGLIYRNTSNYFNLDLAIVSPDMWVYRNRYREANRSFGEIISIEFGENVDPSMSLAKYMRIRGSGKFGLDAAQDFAHRVLSLQPVKEVNELVRMPDSFWWGVGLRKDFLISRQPTRQSNVDIDFYAGTDRAALKANYTQRHYSRTPLTYTYGVGLELIAYDNIVSAPPISPKERHIIPNVHFGLTYDFDAFSIYARDTFSLPTISSDDDLYGVLSAGLIYKF